MSSQLIGQVTDALKLDVKTVTRAERLRTDYYHRVRKFLEIYDYILLPTVGAPAFRLDQPLPTTVGGKAGQSLLRRFFGCYAFSVVGLPQCPAPWSASRWAVFPWACDRGPSPARGQGLEAAASYAAARPEHFGPLPLGTEPISQGTGQLVTPGMRLG